MRGIEKLKVKRIYRDYWHVYDKVIKKDIEQVKSKKETYTIEGLNNRIRHYIARFHRKTHCYSKSKMMVNMTLALFCIKEW